MKIAVACEKNRIAQHFGYCDNFYIFEIDGKSVTDSKPVANPGHKPGFLPRYLNDLAVKVIISGGMGQGAVDLFNQLNIEVVIGVEGEVEDAVKKYLTGQLKYTGEVCHQHG